MDYNILKKCLNKKKFIKVIQSIELYYIDLII